MTRDLLPEIYDGRRPPRAPRPRAVGPAVLLVIVAAAGVFLWLYRDAWIPVKRDTTPLPVRVVRQRPGGSRRAPGAKLTEPEAVLTLRQHLAATARSECLAIASRGNKAGVYLFDVVDSCARTKLGHWAVDGTSKSVRRE